jgi:hypothetical protein
MRLMLIRLLCAAPVLLLSPAFAQDLDLSVVASLVHAEAIPETDSGRNGCYRCRSSEPMA